MDSKTVKLNFLTLGDLENEPISKKKWSVPLRFRFETLLTWGILSLNYSLTLWLCSDSCHSRCVPGQK